MTALRVPNRLGSHVSVRLRLWLALAALALATLVVGGASWATLRQTSTRLDRLHDQSLARVDDALTLSRKATAVAARAPFLLTIESPFRLQVEAGISKTLLADIRRHLDGQNALFDKLLTEMGGSIDELTTLSLHRIELTDRILRLNAVLAIEERRFAALAREKQKPLGQREQWLTMQRISAVLLGAGRSENLIGIGEFHRNYRALIVELEEDEKPLIQSQLLKLQEIASGRDGLFELRRAEIGRRIRAEAAMNRIRHSTEVINNHAAEITATAQANIITERERTISAIAFASGIIVIAVVLSILMAVMAAAFVSGHVTANLRAISDAMMRLAVGDRSIRLPRGEHAGDEIGKLFHAFRAFRANTLRLDRSNRQLAQKNALFENLYNDMSDGLAILSNDEKIIAHNNRLPKLLSLRATTVRTRTSLAQLLEAGNWTRWHRSEGFADLHHPSGTVVELRQSPLSTGGAVALLSDVSERRQLEEHLQSVRRIEGLGRIAGEVAHDFGNILSTVSTNLHLLENATPERAAHLHHTLANALDLGTSLTQRLLAFARRQRLDPEIMNLNELVTGIEDLIALALDDRISLHIFPASEQFAVRLDPGQMESTLLNLCLNASQAIEGEGNIWVRVVPSGSDMVSIEVQDDGRGMPAEVLARAMEPFYSARPDGTGTGLGLAMIFGFIRQSGGDIKIHSQHGHGTTVRLLIPLWQSTDCSEVMKPAGRILLIEDNMQDLAHARRLLGDAELIEAKSAEEAENLLRDASPFDYVLTDLHLGNDVAGWRMAGEALRHSPDTVIAVVSGHMPENMPEALAQSGRVVSVAKPLDHAALARLTELKSTE